MNLFSSHSPSRQKARSSFKENPQLILTGAGYSLLCLHLFIYVVRFIYSLYQIDYSLLPFHLPYLIFWFISPPLLFLYGTRNTFYNYHNFKIASLSLVLANTCLMLLSIVYLGLSRAFLPAIMEIRTNEALTKGMILVLARAVTQLPLLPAGLLLFKGLFYPILDQENRQQLLAFKLKASNSPAKTSDAITYNMNVVKDIRTGKDVTVLEKDRFLHTLVDGTSGTGKTSSTLLPAIRDDLDVRCRAEDIQKRKVKAMEQGHQVTYSPSSGSRGFSINDFTPVVTGTEFLSPEEVEDRMRSIQNQLNEIRLAHPVCGITVMAPDDSLTDDVCNLCDARGIHYNRIDPTWDTSGKRKKNTIGMNPFYLPDYLPTSQRNELIVKKAVIFSDVMQAITDLKGKADSYFTGLNRQMIANIAILVMVTVPVLRHRHASPADLQELINNFELLPEYVDRLSEMDKGINQYTFIIQYIREDLLGKGRTKMEDQSRGTRNIINEFLLMPANREVFCAQNSIDFDRTLSSSEVTVCNYNLASGDTDAIAFGLFFLLSFNNAVLSRPGTERTRLPHFFYLDELPVLIHASLEKNFSLFRKYRVAMFVAIQTLDQMAKNELTKYLKGVILGSAHIIVFGRSSLSDMEVFSKMAGTHDVTEEQASTSETALSTDDPHFSYSVREMTTQRNTLEEIDVRMLDFQEVSFFTTQNGRPLPVIHGRVNFLKPSDWKKQSRSEITFPHPQSAHTNPGADSLQNRESEQALYGHLPGTPVSYFNSHGPLHSPAMPEPTPKMPAQPPEPTDGSEYIDDIF